MELAQGDIILCTVDRIVGTTVFVKIDTPEKELEGTIITSEVAPGRIRNLRDYVVPKKKIVCKVLRISQNQINLSLRRVTQKEKKEVMEQHGLERNYEKVLKNVVGKDYDEIIKKIKEKERLYDFLEESKENPKELEKLAGKENAKKIISIIKEQKEKKIELKKEINLTTTESNGLELIKETLKNPGNIKIRYISAGRYELKITSEDFKKANQEMRNYLESLEKTSREKNLNLTIK